jgi:hypothetical protein
MSQISFTIRSKFRVALCGTKLRVTTETSVVNYTVLQVR